MAVVIPARNSTPFLGSCLDSIRPQLRNDDQLIVIDDASDDDTADVARRHGAIVLSTNAPAGPYAARNLGWRVATAPLISFTDSRCRARADWLDTMRGGFAHDDVCAVGGAVHTVHVPTLAGRVQYRRQGLHARHYSGSRSLMPWFPTGNLMVRRAALERAGGFREVRSGADTELCWRLQVLGLGRVEVIDHITMDWLPKQTLSEFMEQWPRYAAGHAELYREYGAHGMQSPSTSLIQRVVHTARVVAGDLLRHRQRLDVAAIDGLATWVHQRALARAHRQTTGAR